jgi:hypothetical protein
VLGFRAYLLNEFKLKKIKQCQNLKKNT